jgi:alpha-beta hydrolase superfamily lysophospholipase
MLKALQPGENTRCENFFSQIHSVMTMKRWHLFTSFSLFSLVLALLAGCTTLDEKQRTWIFQPSDRTWSGGTAAAVGMEDVWIAFTATSGQPVRLHGLWLASDQPDATQAPVLLYLHGARYNVTGSAPRMRRMQELGFSVLAIDYRGFGKSTNELPSEKSAYEDARAAWDWLAKTYPDRPRYIFGHSLGGPIAINLATEVADERGTIVEGTFTSIADVVSSSPQWGWMPVSLLITQRFEAVRKVDKIGSPLLVVHGGEDRLILPDLGRKLYEAAAEPKLFMLVEGGSHHDTNMVGQPQYRQALAQLFKLK